MAEITDPALLSQLETAPGTPQAEPDSTLTQLLTGAVGGMGKGVQNITSAARTVGEAALQTPSDIIHMARTPSDIPRILKETGANTLSMLMDPNTVAAGIGSLAGPAGTLAGPAIYSSLRDLLRNATGTPVSPEESTSGVTEALTTMAAPGALGKIPSLARRATRTAARNFPGAGVPLQAESAAKLRKMVADIPAPSAAPQYQTLEAFENVSPTPIFSPDLTATVQRISRDLTPLIPGWKVGANPGLQSAATTLEDFLKSGGSTMTLMQAKSLMETLGPRVARAAGPAGGSIKALWGGVKQAVQDAADAGVTQAQALLDAQKTHRRYEAVKATTGRSETGSLREIVESGIQPSEMRGLPEQVNSANIQKALNQPRVAERLAATLSPDERLILQEALQTASKTPRIKTGISTFMERAPVYGAVGLAGAGLGTQLGFGGAQGFLMAGMGAELLRLLSLTPRGRGILVKLASPSPPRGPSALRSVAPALAQQIGVEQND